MNKLNLVNVGSIVADQSVPMEIDPAENSIDSQGSNFVNRGRMIMQNQGQMVLSGGVYF